MRFQVTDALEVAGTRLTQAGYLVLDARIARTGLYTYSGAELGRPDLRTVTVYRPEEAVFDDVAMASFAHKPITDDHPPEDVTADNWRKYSVGQSGGEVVRDGGFVKVPMMLADAAAIKAVQGGKRELSAGYGAEIEFRDGTTPEGEPYQAVMTEIRGNHIAIVDKGRAGSECRIGDQKPSTPTRTETPLKVLIIDGLSVEFSDQGAEAVAKLQKQIADAHGAVQAKEGEIAGLRATHSQAIAAKDGEIGAATAKIAGLEAKLTPAAFDAAVATRSGLVAKAKSILGDTFDGAGKSDADIRRAVVAHSLGDKMPAEADDHFVDGAFRFLDARGELAAPRLADPIRNGLRANDARTADSGEDEYEKAYRIRSGQAAQGSAR